MNKMKIRYWSNILQEFVGTYTIEQIEDGTFADEYNTYGIRWIELERSVDTGLKDKNNKEIYEGDIVQWDARLPKSWALVDHDMQGKVGQVVYIGSEASFRINFLMRGNFTLAYHNIIKVIGNIYANPELLEDK